MLGIVVSRSFRKHAKNLSFKFKRPPLRCYASNWWREILLYNTNDVCDCNIWCKYPVTKTFKKL